MTISISARRKVGATSLELPVFGLGTAHLGELYNLVAERESQAILDTAWRSGLRYFDTAAWYGRGLAEHRLGGLLRTQPRGEFQITTKVGRTLHRPKDLTTYSRAPWTGGLNFEVRFDYSYDGVMRSYEQALQRLALDTVDGLVIHDLDSLFHDDADAAAHERQLFDTGIRALQELKASGEIRAFGVGVNTDKSLETIAVRAPVDFALVAMPYTLLDQAGLHTGMASCVKRGVSVIIGAPFASGILVTGSQAGAKYAYGHASPEVQQRVRRIEDVCHSHRVPLPAAALQFPLAHPAVVSIIPGAARAREVTENIASLGLPIPSAFWFDLKEQGLIDKDAPLPAGS